MPIPSTWARPSVARVHIEGLWKIPLENVAGAWHPMHLAIVAGLLHVLSEVDNRVIYESLSAAEGVLWRQHFSAIASTVRRWESGGEAALDFAHAKALHGLLKKCPDEIVPVAMPRLTFITDPTLRASIARDIDSLDALMKDLEWKAVTVIGGSVVEALLLDWLLHGGNDAKARAEEAKHIAARDKGWKYTQPLDKWDLWKLIAVACDLSLITDTVANVCDGVRDFRNLIHAGRERAEAPCDRGTALAAVAAIENLVAVFSGGRP